MPTHSPDCLYFLSCGHEWCPATDGESCIEFEQVEDGKYYGEEFNDDGK